MINITEETALVITFKNLVSGSTFIAWLDEDAPADTWIIARHGSPTIFSDDRVGRVELRDGTWLGYAGTVPGITPRRHRTRDEAFAWVTGDGLREEPPAT
jgi:hypothetical protein